ncbi:acetylpolyamine aminohydolase [Legionella busanensis]|uniref:Acetylpolyamine aminohydolase n=1 Tax=Legionella busanensis TaxID=190655 RepID=A0A378JU93_9GAMM|nr:hypothetical protein [Legionella busanensis]STX51772.1 acetylpolyamine aminohydolase [Legionella busanensis]
MGKDEKKRIYNTRRMPKPTTEEVEEKKVKKRKHVTSASLNLQEENELLSNQDEKKPKKLKTREPSVKNKKNKREATRTKRRETGAMHLETESKSTANTQYPEESIVKKTTAQSKRSLKVNDSIGFFSVKKIHAKANKDIEHQQTEAAVALSTPEIPKQNLKKEDDESSMEVENLQLSSIVQIPSDTDFVTYRGMCAAAEKKTQDQQQRISKIIDVVKRHNFTLKPTSDAMLKNWKGLFASITEHNSRAKNLFDEIDPNDPIKRALLATHSADYIKSIIDKCVNSDEDSDEEDTDIHINNQTFKVLIKDIATTIEGFKQHHNMIFGIGLPTHHAYREKAAGFCIFNKVAVLIHYFGHVNNVICGLDVNEDDGLRNTLSTSNFSKSRTILHLDSYDSRVYPYSASGNVKYDKVINEQYIYLPLQLDDPNYVRENSRDLHPIMEDLLTQIEQACQNNPRDTAIYLVLGWDSHGKEKAGCSKDIYRGINKTTKEFEYRNIYDQEIKEQRFNDGDFEHFYKQLREVINKYKIPFVYVSLEGGYTEAVNKKQTEMLIKTLLTPTITPQEQSKEEINNYSFV